MLGHYLLVALRNFLRAPFVTLVNALTLALGLVCFLTAYGIVGFWERSEQHFANSSRTSVITTNVTPRVGGGGGGAGPRSNPYVAQYLKTDFPQVDSIARARVAGVNLAVSIDDRIVRLFNVSVDTEFLDIFDLPFVAGDPENALGQPRSAVLTKEASQRLFGDENPMGQTLLVRNLLEVTVTGVIDAIPEPSHMGRSATATLQFDMLTSMDISDWFDDNARDPNTPPPPENWLATGVVTYVMLPSDGSFSAADLDRQLNDFITRHAPPLQLGWADVELGLMPVTEVLGKSNTGTFLLRDSGLTVSTALLLLGGLVLAVACINYANLATARVIGRVRGVGLRKAVGARATQIMGQYLFEVALLTTGALLVALLSIALITPLLENSSGIDLRLSLFGGAGIWISLIGLTALVTVIAGAYPAFVLSHVRPVLALRAGRMQLGARFLPTLLVGVQFTVASFLLITVAVIYLQNQDLKRTGLGIASDPLLTIQNDRAITKLDPNTLHDELLRLPQVSAVGSMAWAPWTMYHSGSLSRSSEESAAERLIFRYIVGYDFFSAFEIPLLAGRVFDREYADTFVSQEEQKIVVDRALIEEFGFGSPESAVGEVVYLPYRLTAGFGGTAAQPMRIIGVVETQPLAMVGTGATSTMYTFADRLPVQIVRISASDVSGALDGIDTLWERLAPGFAINRRFVDDNFNRSYENFMRISQAFGLLSLLALLISTIGLFAMASLITNRRAHEIAVRKTLGANRRQMITMLLRSFSGPVLVANIIAWPLAYIAARTYLDAFIYPIALTPVPFIVCLLFTVLMAWLVVGGQAWRAASLQPANVLHSE